MSLKMADDPVPKDAYQILKHRLTATRCSRMEAVVNQRTRAVRLVIQDIHDPHNVAACMRSAEAFGIQNVDVVTVKQRTRPSKVGRGVHGWLTVGTYDNVESCVRDLRSDGYKIAAGVPSQDAASLSSLARTPLRGRSKIAVVFGNEHEGISPAWHSQIDLPFTIPMVGMVESLNISVSAAITMHQLTEAYRQAWSPEDYLLSHDERQELLSLWATRTMRNWPEELRRLRET